MAQLFLTIVGSAIGGPLGGAVGAALGGYLDSEFFFPAPDIEPPRTAGDQRTQGASEGMGLVFAIGPKVRVPGKIVYTGPEAIRVRPDGGVEEDILIDIGQGVAGSGLFTNDPAQGFLKNIYANGQGIFDISPDTEYTSNQVLVIIGYDLYEIPDFPITYRMWAKVYSYDPAIDLTELNIGVFDIALEGVWPIVSGLPPTSDWQAVLTTGQRERNSSEIDLGVPDGFTSFANLVTKEVPLTSALSAWAASGTNLSTGYPPNPYLSPLWVGTVGQDDVTIFQGNPVFEANVVAGVGQYPGTLTQFAEPIIVAENGFAPERRGRAAVMLVRLNKGKFGNTTPNFEVSYEHDATMTVGEAVHELMQRHGVPAAYYDVSDLTQEFLGLVSEEPIDSLALIQGMMLAYQFDCKEVDGRLVFYPYDERDIVEIDLGLVSSASDGSRQEQSGLRLEDQNDVELPARVEIIYTDGDRGLIQSTARETHGEIYGGSPGQVKRVRTPLTLSQEQAGVMAREVMVSTFQSRVRFSARVPASFLEVCEGDFIRFVGDRGFTGVVTKSELGKDGTLIITGYRRFEGSTVTQPLEVDSEGGQSGGGGVIPVTPQVDVQGFNLLASSSDQAQTPHFGFAYPWKSSNYPSSKLYYTLQGDGAGADPSATYTELAGYVDPSEWSPRFEVITGGTNLLGRWQYLDRRSTLQVSVSGWTPTSATYEEAMSGANRLAVIWQDGLLEELAFLSADLQDDGTFVLSGFLRNLAGDLGLNNGYYVPTQVFALGESSRVAYPVTGGSVTPVWLRAVAPGYSIDDVADRLLVYQGGTARPLSVVNLRTYFNSAAETLEVAWRRQARQPWPIFSGSAPLDLPENYEAYSVKVTDRDTGAVQQFSVDGPPGEDGRVRFLLVRADFPTAAAWDGSLGFTVEVTQVGAFGVSPAVSKVSIPGAPIGTVLDGF